MPGERVDVADSLRDAPRPIEPGARSLLEHRFGRSLKDVRVHTGPRAADTARRAGADAFTVGRDIAFAADRYDPSSSAGLELLAHEVAHTVQQEGVGPSSMAASTPLAMSTTALEREADAAARRAIEPGGAPGSAATALHARAGMPTFSCRAVEWAKLPGGPRSAGGQSVEDYEPFSDKVVRFWIPKLIVPAEKGPVMDAYRATVKAGGDASGLEATIEFDGKRARAGLWESRASTADLNRRWLAKVSWPNAEADAKWHAAGGKKGKAFPTGNPGMVAGTCDMDHIVELQLGGTNVPANIAPLESKENQKSGREIWQTVSGIARELRDLVPDKAGKVNVILSFADVEQIGGEVPVPSSSTAPGCADCTCSQLDFTAAQGAKTAATGNRENYPVVSGAQQATFLVPPGDVPVDLRADEANLANAEVVPGMILGTLDRRKGHLIQAVIESKPHFKRQKATRLPIAIQGGKDEVTLEAVPEDAVRRLRIKGNKDPRVNFTYPYLSTGWLKLNLGDTGLRGDGQMTPSLPLLRNTPIDVHFGEGRFWGELKPDRKKMKLPIPGFEVTDTGLKVDLAPELNATGYVDFKIGKLLTGHVDAQPSMSGIWLKGDLQAHIPKLEQAKGVVEYRNGNLTGRLTIRTEQLGNLPGKPTGEVTLGLTDDGLTAEGKIHLELPGGTPLDLEATKGTRNAIVFTGRTTFTVKGLDPIKVTIRYDGEHFSGEAGTGIQYKSLTGRLTVKYYDGRFSGDTEASFATNRLSGMVHLFIDSDGDLYGDGNATVVVTKEISGKIGITKPKKGDIEVKGELILPRKILLFPGKEAKGTIFERAFNIPVFGPVALQIKPSLKYSAGIGPGTLDDSKVGAGFKPFADEMEFELWASATLSIPAFAEIAAGIGIGIALSAGVGSISGGVDIIGAVRIQGGVFVPFDLRYKGGVFTAAAPVRIEGQLILIVRVKGYLLAEVLGIDLWNPTWDLFEQKFDPGLGFLLIIPLSYASNKPFSLPSFSDFRLEKPKLSTDDLIGAVKGSLGADKLRE